MHENISMEIEPIKCYRLKGIPYIPHYLEINMYVSPGSHPSFINPIGTASIVHEKTLIAAGASVETMILYPRGWVNKQKKSAKTVIS